MHDPAPDRATPQPRFFPAARASIGKYLRKDLVRCLLLAAVAFIARAPGLNGQHIWDDHYLVVENPFMKSPLLLLEAFRQYLFLDSFSSHYRPFQNVSYIFDYFFWGRDPYGFHLTNVLLHSGCGVLLYLLVKHLLASLWFRDQSIAVRGRMQKRIPSLSLAAWFVALLWVVHPAHSAAVDYISGRADSLSFLLCAGGWLMFIRGRAARGTVHRHACYALAALVALLALCSRESAAIWMAIFVSHLCFVERNLTARARLATIAACFLVLGAYAGLRQLPASRPSPPPSAGWSAPMRTVLMARALGDYTRLLIFPTNLHMDRTVLNPGAFADHRSWRQNSGTEYLSLLGLVALAALAYGCARRGAGQPARLFGAAWFLAAYLPISNLLPLNGTVAEHWLYLPAVGFLIFLAGCAFEMRRSHRRAVVALAAVAVLALTGRSIIRSTDWADEETFYTRTIAAGSTTLRVAVNLAQVYSRKGDVAAAERVFRHVLSISPDYPIARNNLASLLNETGRKAEAEELFGSSAQAAVETRKEYVGTWLAALNLAHLRRREGDIDAALAILTRAQSDYPGNWAIIRLRADILRSTGATDVALELVSDFARKHWWHHDAAMAVGRLHAQRGDVERAEKALWHASRLDVYDTQALNLLATTQLASGRLDEAAAAQRRALVRQPDEPRQYLMLSDILTKMGRTSEAAATTARLQRLQAAVAPDVAVN